MISIYNISTGFAVFVKSVSSAKEAREYCFSHNYNGNIDFMWLDDK